jgi:hypothetical protein
MFSLENRINGVLVGYAYVKNESPIDEDVYCYHVEYHRIGKKPNIISFDIAHVKEEGAEKLVFLIYQRIYEKIKNSENQRKKK